MVGNDLIDLQLAKSQSNWQRKGFLEKQFSQKEQLEILKSENPFLKVWLFWSMKEAAYKCYTQHVKKRFFAPQKFECSLISKKRGRVVFEGITFFTSSFYSPLYVYTIAKDTNVETNFFSEIVLSHTIASVLKIKLASKTGVPLKEIEKRKTVVGAPLFYYQNKRVTKSCSISHHGNYGAYVFTLENKV